MRERRDGTIMRATDRGPSTPWEVRGRTSHYAQDDKANKLFSVAEECEVGAGGHEKEQRDGQEQIRARCQEGLTGQRGGVGGGRSGEGSFDDLFIVGPDDAPDVEQHDDAEASADADREDVVVVLADGSVVQERPGGGDDQDRGDGAENVSARRFLNDEKQNCPDRNPEKQEQADRAQRAHALTIGIGSHEKLRPVPAADKNGQQSAPAEQVKRGQSQVLEYLGLHGSIHLFHEGDVDQVKKIEQADPG